jgi:hypothetical protein
MKEVSMSGNQPDPNPFSREGAQPGEGLGSDPNRFDTWADGSTPLAQPAPNYPAEAAPTSQPPTYPTNPSSASPTSFPSYSRDASGPSPYADPEPTDEAYAAFRGYQAGAYSHPSQGVQPYQAYPPAGPYGHPYSPYGPRVSTPNAPYSIPALVLGVASFVSCGITGPVGLGLGIAALKQIDSEPQRYGGRGLAIAGIITGAFGTLFMLLWILSALAA